MIEVKVCPICKAEYRHDGADCGNHATAPQTDAEKAVAAAVAKARGV